jgi:hypothetical protein
MVSFLPAFPLISYMHSSSPPCNHIYTEHNLWGWEVDGTGAGSCLVLGFGIIWICLIVQRNSPRVWCIDFVCRASFMKRCSTVCTWDWLWSRTSCIRYLPPLTILSGRKIYLIARLYIITCCFMADCTSLYAMLLRQRIRNIVYTTYGQHWNE